MLINQHIYGTYGYLAPILHLRRVPGADLYDTYMRSFELVWEESYPYQPDRGTSREPGLGRNREWHSGQVSSTPEAPRQCRPGRAKPHPRPPAPAQIH